MFYLIFTPDPVWKNIRMNIPDYISKSLLKMFWIINTLQLHSLMWIRIQDLFDPRSGKEKLQIRNTAIK